MQWLRAADPGFEESFARVVAHRRESDVDVGRDVAAILADVRERGDAALADYTRRFDGFDLGEDWRISVQDCRAAYDSLEPELRNALDRRFAPRGVALPAALVFDAPTRSAIVDLITRELVAAQV